MTGRPRGFETSEVLELAMELFWKKGYEATGLSELTEQMGIGRQSLYSTFGDKKQLFLQALDAYLHSAHKEVSNMFEAAESPTAALQAWLDAMVLGLCSSQEGSKGCLALNSIVEMCPDHDDVVELIQGHFQRKIKMVAEMIQRGQDSGEIRKDKDPATLATFLMTAGGGLIVASKLKVPNGRGPATAQFLLECIRPLD